MDLFKLSSNISIYFPKTLTTICSYFWRLDKNKVINNNYLLDRLTYTNSKKRDYELDLNIKIFDENDGKKNLF